METLNFSPIIISLIFLIVNGLILWRILTWNRPVRKKSDDTDTPDSPNPVQAENSAQQEPAQADQQGLDPAEILGWEFEYARTTASEAMQDRHTMINFYLLVVAVVTSGVIAVVGGDADLPPAAGAVLLWLLCGIGWLYFLKLIRLRQAWYDSARTMNQIKAFYIEHANKFQPAVLRTAFRWKPETLPPPNKPWNVFFYSVTLIAFLDSVAYVAGGLLLEPNLSFTILTAIVLTLFGLAFFAFHLYLYFAFLRPN